MASSALNIAWSFGFRKDIVNSVHSLTANDRNAIFFLSSHSGVIYDFENRSQIVLQGHCNLISCCSVSRDKRWIATADVGKDSILVIWDSKTGAPIKTFLSPHALGTISVDFSGDSLHLVTIGAASAGLAQDLAIWSWLEDGVEPVVRQDFKMPDTQISVQFDASKSLSICTTGKLSVCFWIWNEFGVEGYAAKISKSDFSHFSGHFTSTTFLGSSGNAVSSTEDGYIVYWESQQPLTASKEISKIMRSASKVLKLVDCGIATMTATENNYLAIGCSDGSVRFYDFFMRLEAWFEDLSAGPIKSLSLGLQRCPFSEMDYGSPGLHFWVPDFVVATSDAFIVGVDSTCFDEIRPEDRRGVLLMQGMADSVSSIACHPYKSQVVFGCVNGTLQIWDYELKLLLNLKEFESSASSLSTNRHNKPQSLAFEPAGDFIAVGFSSGLIKFLKHDTIQDIANFAPSSDAILSLKFSPSGNYLSAVDESNHVMIFKRLQNSLGDSAGTNGGFTYLGRIKSHSRRVTGLEFGFREQHEVLLSVGEDRRCVEYDLEISSVSSGICCVTGDDSIYGARVIERSAYPTALVYHPHTDSDVEDRFIFATSDFKMKEINVDSKQCRKTTLAPTFGGSVKSLLQLEINISGGLASNFFAYATASKVIGLGCLPLTGNPDKVMGIVAHPGAISALAASRDGKYLFSAGGPDLTVNMWTIDIMSSSLYSDLQSSDELTPFYKLLDGGEGGNLHSDIVDYFYFCQIRTQGEGTMENRNVSGKIPLSEISSLMRAIGFYPTEEEIASMVNEVRYKSFMNTGELIDSIGLVDLIKLYINHRPVQQLDTDSIVSAFAVLARRLHGDDAHDLSWAHLSNILLSEGEPLLSSDLDPYLSALIGADAKNIAPDSGFNYLTFYRDLLGLEQDSLKDS